MYTSRAVEDNDTWTSLPLFQNLTTADQALLPSCSSWTFRTLFMLITSVFIILFNITLATVLFVRKENQSSFSTYVISLLLFNSLKAIHGFIGVVQTLCPHILHDPTLCNFRNYVGWCILGLPDNLHIIIALNRVWAVGLPVSYRLHHSTKLAVSLAVFVVFYVHAINLPGVVMDSLYYRQPIETYGCYINPEGMPIWYQTAMLVVYEFPGVIITVAWVFVVWKRKKQKSAVQAFSVAASTHAAAAQSTTPKIKRSTASFTVFTALTFSAVICWLPYETLFVIWSFRPLNEFEQSLIPYLLSLNTVQPVLDPILIVLTSQSLKALISRITKCS